MPTLGGECRLKETCSALRAPLRPERSQSPLACLKFADIPNGLAGISNVSGAGCGPILAYGAFCGVSPDQSAGTKAAAGDFGFSVLASSDPAEKTKNLTAELANEKFAIMAIIGMFLQDGRTGFACGACSLCAASPLRATEVGLGVEASVGFCDPGGFTADGNSESFARRRQTGLRHARDSMLAAMDYITPEITGMLPGYLSPSAGLEFADTPNGLVSIARCRVQAVVRSSCTEPSAGFRQTSPLEPRLYRVTSTSRLSPPAILMGRQ